jgi:hypothetical protein
MITLVPVFRRVCTEDLRNHYSALTPETATYVHVRIKEAIRQLQRQSGTDVMILKIFSPKNSEKKLGFLTRNKAKLCNILIITLVFEKTPNFSAENCRKSQKIVIITSTP